MSLHRYCYQCSAQCDNEFICHKALPFCSDECVSNFDYEEEDIAAAEREADEALLADEEAIFWEEEEEREDNFRDDVEADADALANAGWGTDEDYGGWDHYDNDVDFDMHSEGM